MIIPDFITNTFVNDLINRGLKEDVGTGDVTTLATVDAGTMATAVFTVRQDGVVAGLWMADRVFETVEAALHTSWHVDEGAYLVAGSRVGKVKGPARGLLTSERLALNIMQRMSGIASATRKMTELAASYGTKILDTRKTAPGLRALDKWAVQIGGGENHRLGLFDMILIKDNHIKAAGGIEAAVAAARRFCMEDGRQMKLEIEVRSLEELELVLGLEGVDVILLDNMAHITDDGVDVSVLRKAVEMVGGRVPTEASGNITLDTVGPIASTGVTFISSGALTHSVTALDIGLDIELDGTD